jgi:hypothetical protein
MAKVLKISELIKELEEAKRWKGDVDVYFDDCEWGLTEVTGAGCLEVKWNEDRHRYIEKQYWNSYAGPWNEDDVKFICVV